MKKIISTLLVVALLLTVLTVGIATTSAAETATITIYGLDGTTKTQEVNVGDTFTVYTTLDVSGATDNGKVGSIEGNQTYTSSILSLVDPLTGQYGEFADPETVFPITGATTMANAATLGSIYYNASMPSGGYKFDTEYSKLIVTTYKVKAAGNAEVKNALVNLAAADTAMTKIVYKGQLQSGKTIGGIASFTDPVPEIDHAHVTIYKLDGTTEEKDFHIGDTFDVYTMLNVSASVADGKVGSITAAQKYTTSVLELADTVNNGEIVDLTSVFPITKTNTVTNCKTAGLIKYSASSANGFLFSDDNCQLIKTKYNVTTNGFADIRNSMIVLAAADEDATRIVFSGETQPGKSYNMPASFYPPGEAPTEAPPTEAPPTEPGKLNVTIIGLDGTQTVQSYNIGDEFTVYTMLDITGTLANGQVADVDGSQTYDTAKLQLTDAVTPDTGEIVNKTAMFPILGDSAVASAKNGTIKFNASKPGINNGFVFNSDKSKLIVTNYKVVADGNATVRTSLKTLVGADADVTKIVYKGVDQPGTSYNMYESFTDPGVEPTQPETQPAPTEEPATEEPPTEEPPTEEPPTDKAKITIYDINGNSTQKTFGVGETFTVYTSFDVSATVESGMISSIAASQTFSTDVLETADSIDSIGVVQNTTEMFPVFGAQATAKIADGINKYNASTPYINNGFLFNSDDCLLIVTKYTVTAAGTGEIRNAITTCAAADMALTRLVSKGVIQPGVVLTNRTDFYPPGYEPTEAPATEPPTEPPVTTADITIYDVNGHGTTKTYNVGDTFTVYTTFDASKNAPNGIASINATQTFSTDVLESADTVDRSGLITDLNTVFPILGENAVARVTDGTIKYNASKPTVNDGFAFNDESDLLIVTKYTVTAAGTGEVRNAITTCVASDLSLTRLVDKGVVQPGVELGGIASFTKPEPLGDTFLLGDVDDNGEVESFDVTYIQRYDAYMDVPCDLSILERNGDVDDNGYTEVIDATYIQRWLSYMDVPYPVGEYITRN